MTFFKKLSAFQTAVLEKLSNTYYELLPMLLDHFKSEKVYFMIQREDKLDIITYIGNGKVFENARVERQKSREEAAELFKNSGKVNELTIR